MDIRVFGPDNRRMIENYEICMVFHKFILNFKTFDSPFIKLYNPSKKLLG